MSLDAATRSSIYLKLAAVIGDDDANALMSEFPASDADELVTRDHLRAELALTRGELRHELHTEIGALRHELHTEIGALRNELHTEIGALRNDIHELRTEMADRFRRHTVWTVAMFFTFFAAQTTVLAALR
ncbi:MAG: hypothetical protein R2690_06765 [Acidimicrobiales bacterium]